MWHFIKGHSKEFWKFFTGGYVVWGGLLFSTPPLLNNIVVAFILKVIGAGILAFATGIGTILGQEFIKKHTHKIFKNKKDGKEEDEGKKGVA